MNEANDSYQENRTWLGLSEAANLLGIHFTTLRRWADTGKIACVRTPGGRRRFLRADLDHFLNTQRGRSLAALSKEAPRPKEEDANVLVRQQIHQHEMLKQNWMGNLDEVQRMRFKYSGQMLLGLLMQYNSRTQGGDAFLKEAERMSEDYGSTFQSAGLSISDTARAFLFFRHSITDMIFDTSSLDGPHDEETRRLFQRTNQFMDALLLAVLEGYCRAAQTATIHSPKGTEHASDPSTQL